MGVRVTPPNVATTPAPKLSRSEASYGRSRFGRSSAMPSTCSIRDITTCPCAPWIGSYKGNKILLRSSRNRGVFSSVSGESSLPRMSSEGPPTQNNDFPDSPKWSSTACCTRRTSSRAPTGSRTGDSTGDRAWPCSPSCRRCLSPRGLSPPRRRSTAVPPRSLHQSIFQVSDTDPLAARLHERRGLLRLRPVVPPGDPARTTSWRKRADRPLRYAPRASSAVSPLVS